MRMYSVGVILAVAALTSSVSAALVDDFESGVANWGEVQGGVQFVQAAGAGNPGSAGHYTIGLDNGLLRITADAWTAASLPDESNYAFFADVKIGSEAATHIGAKMNGRWTLDYVALLLTNAHTDTGTKSWGAAGSLALVAGGVTLQTYTAATLPNGAVYSPGDWNRIGVVIDGDEIAYYLNDVLLSTETAPVGTPATGRPGIRTGWTGNVLIDNVHVFAVPEPTTAATFAFTVGAVAIRRRW